MELRLDCSKTYAIALEGGGGKGAYQIGAWKALEEAGVKYNAVSGTSVGALNGAFFAMRDMQRAEGVWEDIRFSRVMDVNDEEMRALFKAELRKGNLRTYARRALDILKSRGFDVTPLRQWICEVVDEETVRKSDVDFYIITYSLSNLRSLELRASELDDGQLHEMLLASAYLPVFKNEKIGGKRYTDGGVADAVPVHALVANGYKDIIVIRLNGFGLERWFKMPGDVTINTIAPTAELGSVLNFDREQSVRNKKMGYYDTMRMLYGLYGSKYYIDRTLGELEAYDILRGLIIEYYSAAGKPISLRKINEKILPRMERGFDSQVDYYDLLINYMERLAERLALPEFRIVTEKALMDELAERLYQEGKTLNEEVPYIMKTRMPGPLPNGSKKREQR